MSFMSDGMLRTRKWFTRVSLVGVTRSLNLLSKILPYRPGVLFGGALGFVSYYVLPRERKRAITHLSLAFREKGEAWIRRIARRTFVHLGKSLMEALLMTPERLSRVVEFLGQEKVAAALAQGRGVVSFTGHIGNWEIMAQALAARFPLSGVAVAIEPKQVNDLLVGLRARMGIRTILRNRPGASRELIRIFRENRVLGLLIDQDTDVDGAFVDFMGRPAWTPTAVASMAIKFHAPVFFGHIKREKDDRHTVIMEGPLQLIRTGDNEKDIISNTAVFTKMMEACILQNPEQWVWMHRRWRRQP